MTICSFHMFSVLNSVASVHRKDQCPLGGEKECTSHGRGGGQCASFWDVHPQVTSHVQGCHGLVHVVGL